MSARLWRACVAGLVLLAGCEAAPDGAAEAPGARGQIPGDQAGGANVGSFSMSLTIGGGYRFAEVRYDVSGNGFHKAGTIDAVDSTTVSAIVDGIPFGTGYLLQLTAQDVDHKLAPCTGSAMFDVTSPATVPVPVHLACHQLPQVQTVPVPRWATFVLAGALLALGAAGSRRRKLRV
jgi:hypothetical protein